MYIARAGNNPIFFIHINISSTAQARSKKTILLFVCDLPKLAKYIILE